MKQAVLLKTTNDIPLPLLRVEKILLEMCRCFPRATLPRNPRTSNEAVDRFTLNLFGDVDCC